MGVERIFASPGSDWAPLWEALARPHAPVRLHAIRDRHAQLEVEQVRVHVHVMREHRPLRLYALRGATTVEHNDA